jgi:hypothetical protein
VLVSGTRPRGRGFKPPATISQSDGKNHRFGPFLSDLKHDLLLCFIVRNDSCGFFVFPPSRIIDDPEVDGSSAIQGVENLNE